jgi:hypothetical protein
LEAEALPSGLWPGRQLQQWAGGKVSVLTVEDAGVAVMGEVGDAQAKNIHTVEKFEKSVRKREFFELWCLEFPQSKGLDAFYLEGRLRDLS